MREQFQAVQLPPLICFCHLRWNFVYQRPQHLIGQWGAVSPVHFYEEPQFVDAASPTLNVSEEAPGVYILTPMLPQGLDDRQIVEAQRRLLDDYIAKHGIHDFIAWYY